MIDNEISEEVERVFTSLPIIDMGYDDEEDCLWADLGLSNDWVFYHPKGLKN